MSEIRMIEPGELVSVVIPCFNRAQLVEGAIRSALNQTDVDVEVIVVDDGSTDRSWDVITAFGERVRCLRTANNGVSAARNQGVELARGTLIKFLDSDDELVPNALFSQLRQLRMLPPKSVPVGGLMGGARQHSGSPLVHRQVEQKELTPYLLASQALQVSQPLFLRSAIKEVGGFRRSSISEDHELVVYLALLGYRFFYCSEPVVMFFDHDSPERLSRCLTAERFAEVLGVFERLLAKVSEGGSSSKDEPQFRDGLGQLAWSMGRRAVRLGHYDVGRQLFSMAYAFSGSRARKARLPLQILYSMLNPVQVEQMAIASKRLLRR